MTFQPNKVFHPKNICVVGASSTDPSKFGSIVVENLVKSGYPENQIYPVNPKGGKTHGIPIHKNFEDIPPIDLAYLVVGSALAPQIVDMLGKHGCHAIAVVSSGFSEIGEVELEREIVKIAKSHGSHIIGPNIFGLISENQNGTIVKQTYEKGGLSIIPQSGAIAFYLMTQTRIQNAGLRRVFPLGNMADICFADVIPAMISDPGTEVILLYLEGIKTEQGIKLLPILREASKLKPIVAITTGKSKRGAIAVSSHTGSLASNGDLVTKMMEQAGVHVIERIDHGLQLCKYLSSNPLPKGKNAIIVGNGGGFGSMATDAFARHNVPFFEDEDYLEERFGNLVCAEGSVKNPIDITANGNVKCYLQVLETALQDEKVHAILANFCYHGAFEPEELIDGIKKLYEEYPDKPIAHVLYAGEEMRPYCEDLKKEGIPLFPDVDDASLALGHLYTDFYNRQQDKEEQTPVVLEYDPAIPEIIQKAAADKRKHLSSGELFQLADLLELNTPESITLNNAEEFSLLEAMGMSFPLIAKVVSPQVLHRTNIGGVIMNICNIESAESAFEALRDRLLTKCPGAKFDGVEYCEQISGQPEIIIGATRDKNYGITLTFGQGGIYTEVLNDVSFRHFPCAQRDIKNLLQEPKVSECLGAVRNQQPRNLKIVQHLLTLFGSLMKSIPEIEAIECNPAVFRDPETLIILDFRVTLEE